MSGSSQGTSTSSSSSSGSCACSVVASHGMVIISGNCKPSCPAGHNGTPTTEDRRGPLDATAEPPQEAAVPGGEVIASGSCFPDGEDEPSASEEAVGDVS